MSLVMPRMPARWPRLPVRESPAPASADLQALIECTRDMIWSVDLNYRLVTFNKAVSDEFIYNLGIKATAGMEPGDLFPPDEAALWPPLYERALDEGRFQTEFRMADGRTLELELNPIVEDGEKTGVWVISKDITERKATRQSLISAIEALRATEERYRAAFQTSIAPIAISRMSDGRYVDVNKAFLDQFGFSREEVLGRTGLELGVWHEPREREILMETVRREGKCRNLEVQGRLNNGEVICTLVSATTIEVDGATCLLSVGRDVTEQKRAETALRESRNLLRLFVEQAPVELAMFDREMRYVAVSRRWLENYPFKEEEVIGRSHYEIAPNLPEHFKEAHRRGLAGETLKSDEDRYTHSDGKVRWVRWQIAPWRAGDGSVGGIFIFTENITEHKLEQAALRESKELLQLFIKQSPASLVMLDREMRHVAASLRFLEAFSLKEEEIIGRSHYDVIPWIPEPWKEAHRRGMAGEFVRRDEEPMKMPDGTVAWTRYEVMPWRTGNGDVGGIIICGEDITERKRGEEALERAEEKFRVIFESAPVGIAQITPDGKTLTLNPSSVEMLGYESEAEAIAALNNTSHDPWVDPADRAHFAVLIEEQGTVRDFRCQYRRKDGNIMWVSLTARKITGPDGKTIYQGFNSDITSSIAAEDARHKAEERFREIFEDAPEGIFQVTPDRRVLAWNPALVKMLGYESVEEAIAANQNTARDLWIDPPERARFIALLERQGAVRDYGHQLKRKDGSLIWVSSTARKISGPDGKTLYYQGFVQDLTPSMAAEDARSKAEQRFREIFEDAPEAIFRVTPEGRALAFNPAQAQMLGYESPAETIAAFQSTAHDLWPDSADRTRFLALLEQQGTVHDYRHQLKRRDGSPIWVTTTARRISGPDGKTIYYQGFTQDITEQMRLGAALEANNRELKLLSEINGTLVSAKTEMDLLRECCRIMVETGGYRMAWVGFAGEGPEKPLITTVYHGCEESYLQSINLTWADNGPEDGPVGRSLRTGEVQIEEDICADPLVHSWRTETVKQGYRMAIALPFRLTDGAIASLVVFGETPGIRSGSERSLMEQIASDLAYGIESRRTELEKIRHQQNLHTALEQTIQLIAETVDQRDPYTAGHQRRVAHLCMRIARKLRLPRDRAHGLHLAASIHDLGKIGIPAEILSKPGLLTPTQFNLLKEHAQLGYDILKNVAFPWPIADMILQHHEHLDGSGYPRGLKGDAISLEARILAVADVVEAMSSHRPYRAAKGIEAALDEILAQSGRFYDAQVAEACVRVFREDGYTLPAQAS